MKQYSLEHQLYLKDKKRLKKFIIFSQLNLFILFFFIWELLVHYGFINEFLFSSPTKIISCLWNLLIHGNLISHISITFFEILASFLLSISIGFLISAILWACPFLAKVLDPYLTILNSLPKVALGPLIILWFGASIRSIVFMSLLISLFVTIINIYQGFQSVPNHFITLFHSLHASKWQLFRFLILPYNRSNIISTLKVNLSMNLIGVIMGELLVSKKGIGYLIMYGSQIFNIHLVISCVFLLGIISYLLYLLIHIKKD